MSEEQEALWRLARQTPEQTLDWRITGNLHLHGKLNLTALRQAIQSIVDRHAALRTTIEQAQPVQVVHPQISMPVELVDLTQVTSDKTEEAIGKWLIQETARPFSLWEGPLLRAHVLTLSQDHHLLSLAVHHIVSDGWSTGVILEELATRYAAECQGRPLELPPPHPYQEFVQWQAAQRQSMAMLEHEQYWLAQFRNDFPVAQLPTDHVRPEEKRYCAERYATRLDAEFYAQIKASARQHRTTLFMTLLAAYSLLLHHLTGQQELVIGTPTAGRAFPHSDRMVGYCTHFLPMRSRLSDEMTMATYLATLKQGVLAAYKHQDYPFARLFNHLSGQPAVGAFPALTTIFNLDQAVHFPDLFELQTTVMPSPVNFALVDYRLDVVEVNGELWLDYEYQTDLFAQATIARWHEGFCAILRQLINHPEQPVQSLCIPVKAATGES